MRLKLYRAASMADAMAQLRSELGPDALLLSSRRVDGGVELTAALDQPEEPPAASLPAAAHGLPAAGLNAAYHGIPGSLAARLAGTDLPASLRSALRFGKLPLQAGPEATTLLLAGPPGAGKTLSVARLATRLVLAGNKPLVVTADGRRAGGAEELAAYTRLLGLTLLAASTPSSLSRALAQAEPGSPVLIDTSGVNPFDEADMQALSALMQAANARSVLVLAAGGHPEEAAEQAAAFAKLGIQHFLPTRLDATRRLGSVLAAAEGGLILTEAGVGTGATDGLAPLTPEFLAERLLSAAPPPAFRTPESRNPESRTPESRNPAYRTPVFPTARSRVAHTMDSNAHG